MNAGPLDKHGYACLQELLADAQDCPRLSDWEDQFLGDLRLRAAQEGCTIRLSDKQREALRRIEQKVYASG